MSKFKKISSILIHKIKDLKSPMKTTSVPSAGAVLIKRIFDAGIEERKILLSENLAAHICIHEAGHYVFAAKAKDISRGFKITRIRLGNISGVISDRGYAGGVEVDLDLVGEADVLEFLLAGAAAETIAYGSRAAEDVMSDYLHPTSSRGDITKAISRGIEIEGLSDAEKVLIFKNDENINVVLSEIIRTNGERSVEVLVDNLDLLQSTAIKLYDIWAAAKFIDIDLSGDELSHRLR